MDQSNKATRNVVKAKEAIARKGKAAGIGSGSVQSARDRLPPGQKLVSNDWPLLDLGIRPEISTADWTLEITGAAEAGSFNWDEFNALPQSKLVTDFHCVTTWSIYDAEVEGVLWQDLLAVIQLQSDASHALFHSYDGYTTNLPLEELGKKNVCIIHSFGGKPLTREHGGPVRMWLPHLYGWKSAKWVKKIEFLTADKPGFWEVRGYHNHGDPWLEERFS